MALKMVRPTRRKGSANLRHRCRIPTAILGFAQGRPVVIHFPASGDEPAYTAQATLGKAEVSFSLGTSDPSVAKERTAIADQYLERLFSTLEAQKANGGAQLAEGGAGAVTLTAKQCYALAGQWYRAFVAAHEDDPPAMATLEAFARYMADPEHVVSFDDEGRPHYDVGLIQLIRKELLIPHGLAEPDAPTWAKLAEAVVKTVRQGLATVKRYADGDYRPDTVPDTFPPLEWSKAQLASQAKGEAGASSKGAACEPSEVTQEHSLKRNRRSSASPLRNNKDISFDDLLDQWWNDVQHQGITISTRNAYQAAFRALATHAGHTDAQRITTADIEAFRDDRLAEGKAYKTVTQQTRGIGSVYGWAVEKKILNINPAEGVKMPKRRQVVTQDKDFTEGEAKVILRAASVRTDPAKRWIPWLCAYTGARAGEIAQLRKQDIRQDEHGGWIINITPDAGTVKNKHFREVPLHEHLIEQGFTEFVTASPDGYLFLPVSLDANEEQKETARSRIIQMVATCTRKAVDLPKGKQPNHAWRHTFKTRGREAGISEHTLDALCGHTPNSVGASYGKVSLKVKREAIDRLPKFEV